MRRSARLLAVAAAVVVLAPGGPLRPAPARAGIGGAACSLLGTIGEGWWGKACNGVLGVGSKLVGGGKKVAGVISKVAGNPLLHRGAGIAAIVAWVLGGAKWTIDHMGQVIGHTTSPTLTASWFTGVYLRVQAIAVFFTLLFICAAACEAVLRSDMTVLTRAVFGYLPLAALLTLVAAPVTMLLLAATDQLSAGLEQLAGHGATQFLTGTGAWVAAGLTAADPFFAVIAGGLVVAAGGALWVEMLIREIAVYLVVAMLPVVFASMVWPARRVWAIRTVEVLVTLILAKVAIVCVLALGGAALAHAGAGSLTRLLGGLALVVLGAFSPWLLLRLIPMAEVASAAVGHIRGHLHASAGVRTPESALAGSAVSRVAGRRNGNGHGAGAAETVAIAELLEQMHRRAQSTTNGSESSGHALAGTAEAHAVTPAAPVRPRTSSAVSTPNPQDGGASSDTGTATTGPALASAPPHPGSAGAPELGGLNGTGERQPAGDVPNVLAAPDPEPQLPDSQNGRLGPPEEQPPTPPDAA